MDGAGKGAATPPVITFRGEDHSYTLDGKPAPSVSTIIECGYDFRFVDPDKLAAASDKGRKVHKVVELSEAGTLNRPKLDPVLERHLQQWERFKDDVGFLPLAHEVMVASRTHHYCGTLDCHGLLLPMAEGDVEEALLLDIKTGAEYPIHKLQTAGYLYAANEMELLPRSTKRASLYLSEDGYALRWHSGKMDTAAFLSLATFKHWSTHHGK